MRTVGRWYCRTDSKTNRTIQTMSEEKMVTKLPHHIQEKLCETRPPYRQGRRLTAVKVYTVNDESQHIMICGVPKLQLIEEVEKLVYSYGIIKKINVVPEYPADEFTEAYHVHYARIQSARIAKKLIDGKNFYGSLLHVFYVPELESISETRTKLSQRRRDITVRIKRNQRDSINLDVDKFIPKEQYHRKKKTPALPLTEDRLLHSYPGETMQSIYNGIPKSIDPRSMFESNLSSNCNTSRITVDSDSASNLLQAPYQPTDIVIKAASSKVIANRSTDKRKNYKGQIIDGSVKVKVIRPQIIDTRNIIKRNISGEKKIFQKSRKLESGGIAIKIRLKHNDERKRIVIKNPSIKQLIQPNEDLQHSIQSAKYQIREAMEKQRKCLEK